MSKRLSFLSHPMGWSLLCCCAPFGLAAQTVDTGPAYYTGNTYYQLGASGSAGSNANGDGGNCNSGPVPGTAGQAGPAVSGTVTYSPASDPFNGTIVVAGSTGGKGGAGGGGDPQGQCGKGDFAGRQGGAGGNVAITVAPGSDAPAQGYTLNSTGIAALSRGGTGGKGGDNTRGKDQYSAGDGGAAGSAGSVNVTNSVAFKVTGGASHLGIVAQSAGGQGGEGGSTANGKATGGSGLPGGAGAAVTVDNRAAISTDGGIAIAAQSIGGFGGDAGVNTKGYGGGGGYGGNVARCRSPTPGPCALVRPRARRPPAALVWPRSRWVAVAAMRAARRR
jgi:hypothetical protein